MFCYDCGVFIEKYMYTKFRLDWLLRERVLCPYCFIVVLQEVHCLPNCLSEFEVAITSTSFVTLCLMVSEIVVEVSRT